jgi:hypothetical protein
MSNFDVVLIKIPEKVCCRYNIDTLLAGDGSIPIGMMPVSIKTIRAMQSKSNARTQLPLTAQICKIYGSSKP